MRVPKLICFSGSLVAKLFADPSDAGVSTAAADDAEEGSCACYKNTRLTDPVFKVRTVLSSQMWGSRSAVAADLDGDGDIDVVASSSYTNTVFWFENQGRGVFSDPYLVSSQSIGVRSVATGDVDGDGRIDIIAGNYEDSSVVWYQNIGGGKFGPMGVISASAMNVQHVHTADIDGDGDLDVISASSGDDTVTWYENLGIGGTFCEVKRLVDTACRGARTAVAADLDGDGDVDIASASKSDNTFAWYPNQDGKGLFGEKRVIDDGAHGAYHLFPVDVDQDGHMDLVAASNGDDTVALYRNLGGGARFERRVISSSAAFVLSVFAADLDQDGDIDVASASYNDGKIRWFENDGSSMLWLEHIIYEGSQGHSVVGEDLDGDGDADLIAVTTSESTVAIFTATTNCTHGAPSEDCCRLGQEWNGTACAACAHGWYGVDGDPGRGPRCVPCPSSDCSISGHTRWPLTCDLACGTDVEAAYAACDCLGDMWKNSSDICTQCGAPLVKTVLGPRTSADVDWVGFEWTSCALPEEPAGTSNLFLTVVILSALFSAAVTTLVAICLHRWRHRCLKRAAAAKRYKSVVDERIERACVSTKTCLYSVTFIRYTDFKDAGKLLQHEVHRDRGKLIFLDCYQEAVDWVADNATVFVSHQWLGFTEPDPENAHFRAICCAAEALCHEHGLGEDELFIWVDYTSIPQTNTYLKGLSIGSLAVYASVARFFVIIAPSCKHYDREVECNPETYQRRGWCRLEQWARMISGGLDNMYLLGADGEMNVISDDPAWYTMACRVFEGDFTVEDDKHSLVDIIIGLWYTALVDEAHGDSESLKEYVMQNKDEVFPKKYFESLIQTLENKVIGKSRRLVFSSMPKLEFKFEISNGGQL